MTTYPSLYRAKATRWTGQLLQTFIPQVFGEAQVDITSFLNEPTVGLGWVMFQGGDAEHPVWLGPISTAAPQAPTEDWSDDIAALQATDVDLAGDITTLSGDIDGLQATDVSLDARVDALEADVDTPNWYSAWGTITVGTLATTPVTVPVGTGYSLLGTIVISSIVGRRYRLAYVARAYGAGTTSISNRFVPSTTLPPTLTVVTSPLGLNRDHYIQAARAWQGGFLPWGFEGDGATRTIYLLVQSSTLGEVTIHQNEFYLEDLGPIAAPPPVLPTPAPSWEPVTFNNANWRTHNADPVYACQYRVIGDEVMFRGLAQRINVALSAAETIIIPPPGLRGVKSEFWNPIRSDALEGRIITHAGGIDVTVTATNWPTLPLNGWISLAGIRYSVTP